MFTKMPLPFSSLALAASLVLLSGGLGCVGFGSNALVDPSENPTWTNTGMALLEARCVMCHQSPPRNGAPPGFTFQKYSAEEGDPNIRGAFEMRERIKARAFEAQTMPPNNVTEITAEERALLNLWVELGAPFE